jgi:hypothetical protein
MIYLKTSDIPASIRNAAGYSGSKWKVEARETISMTSGYWDGGSKTDYTGVNLETGQILPCNIDEPGNPFTNPGTPIVKLQPGFAILAHSIFCGKDSGITIYVHPENVQSLLPAPSKLSGNDRIVLYFTRSHKSSYGGIKNYRFHEAHSRTGITETDWESTKKTLQERGLLDSRGAITVDGKNAISDLSLCPTKQELLEV